MEEIKRLRPQEGPQENFLSSPADIAIYGGAAGGGKTWGLLLEPLRHINNRKFGAVFFRRSTVQIRNEGGLWDESADLYQPIGGHPREHRLDWKFPSGATISFSHLEHEKTVKNWQGSQIPLICFDELTHFSESQFFYMVSRNRSMCGVRPYIRASCNPDADSWVASFIAWWIDQETGYPIPERSGVLRYFVRVGDAIYWADQPQDLADHKAPDEDGNMIPIPPKSVTFISAKLQDNKALMKADPNYIANLMALSTVERERLLGGNWKIRAAAGLLFRREWVEFIDPEEVPHSVIAVRGWDLAATPKEESNDPDWTAGTKIAKDREDTYYVLDHVFDRKSPAGVEKMMKNTASRDGKATIIDFPQDPGASGKAQVATLSKLLKGYRFQSSPETGSKVTRFGGFSAQAENGNVKVVRGPWNERWLSQLEGFPEAKHDDDADSTSRAFNAVLKAKKYNLKGAL